MYFDDIIRDIGGYGLYQKLVLIFVILPSFTVMPWFTMHPVFITNIPEHWCYVPEVAHSNLSLEEQKALIQPPSDPKCRRYVIDYAKILETGIKHVDEKTPTMPCDHGWVYDKTYYDATAVTAWDLVCKNDFWVPIIIASTFFGALLGAPVFHLTTQKLGVKISMLAAATVVAVCDVASALSPLFTFVIIFRVTVGMAAPTIYSHAYQLVVELMEKGQRGRLGSIATVSWMSGTCLVPFLAWVTRDWVKLCAVSSICAAALLPYAFFICKSPTWMIGNKRYDEATDIFFRIAKFHNKATPDLYEKIRSVILERAERDEALMNEINEVSYSVKHFLTFKTLRRRFILVLICWFVNAIVFFGLMMNSRNLSGDKFEDFFLASAVEVPAHFATSIAVETLGRRCCIVTSFALSFAALILPVPFHDVGEIGILSTIMAKGFSSAIYATIYLQGPELFPECLKEIGLTCCSVAGTLGAVTAAFVSYLNKFGTYVPFGVFALVTAIGFVCSLFLPETLHKKQPLTIYDAEVFEKDWSFFSCKRSRNDHTELRQVSFQEQTENPTHRALSEYSVKTVSPQDQHRRFTSPQL